MKMRSRRGTMRANLLAHAGILLSPKARTVTTRRRGTFRRMQLATCLASGACLAHPMATFSRGSLLSTTVCSTYHSLRSFTHDRAVRLDGNFSIVGRSVVIHDAPTDTPVACGNITSVTMFADHTTWGPGVGASASHGAHAPKHTGTRQQDSHSGAARGLTELSLGIVAVACLSLGMQVFV
jgi:hypothetical protein